MPRYTFRFNVVEENQVWFDAETEEQARELLGRVENDELNISDLPNAEERNRGLTVDTTVSFIEKA